ncbi:hypothetical protein A2U01_0044014, partial [Trifolium medium]|nr:hypothetical protein [Trifolium medium]
CESLLALSSFTPISIANLIPVIRASYSAWLLLALNSNLKDCSINTSSGPSSTTPSPLPLRLEAPSTDRIHACDDVSPAGADSSTTKSASTWALIQPLGTKVISNSDSSNDYATILPARSGFFNTCLIG